MPGVCNHGLRIENVSSHSFGNRHAKIGVETYSSYAHPRIIFVCRGEIGIVVVMMRMDAVRARLRLGEGSHWTVSRIEAIRERLEFRKRVEGDAGLLKGSKGCGVEGGSLENPRLLWLMCSQPQCGDRP